MNLLGENGIVSLTFGGLQVCFRGFFRRPLLGYSLSR
jgi:hypothetical protein